MTIFLVLGLFAGLYMIWLLFSLAVYALPVGAGIALALWLYDHSYGYPVAILGGLGVGITVLIVGQFLLSVVCSPAIRMMIGLLFAVPAGVAGYHAVEAVLQLAIDAGPLLSALSWAGGLVIAATAWKRLACPALTEAAPQPYSRSIASAD